MIFFFIVLNIIGSEIANVIFEYNGTHQVLILNVYIGHQVSLQWEYLAASACPQRHVPLRNTKHN